MFENTLVVAVGSWLAGVLASVVVQQVLNRRLLLSYFVQHFRVGASADDKTFGNVQITWNGAAVQNLYLSTIQLTNESSRDLQNVRIKAFSNDTVLLSEFPQLVGTTEFLRYTPEYETALTVSPGQSPSPSQWETHGKQREYVIPVLNRGQIVRLQYLNTSKSDQQPNIWLEAIHPGVLVKYRHPHPQVFGVSQPWAILSGVLLGLLFATIMFAYSPLTWLTAFGCLFFGLVAQVPGAHAVRILRAFRQWLAG